MKNRIAYSTGEIPSLTLLSQKKMYTLEQLQSKTFGELKKIGWELNVLPKRDRRYRESWINALAGVNLPLLQLLETSPADVQAQESPIIETVEASPGVEVDAVQEPPIESKFGRIVYPRPAQEAIAKAVETSPGVDRAQERVEEYLDLNELWELDHADCPACGGIDSLDARWSQEYANGFWIIYCDQCDLTG